MHYVVETNPIEINGYTFRLTRHSRVVPAATNGGVLASRKIPRSTNLTTLRQRGFLHSDFDQRALQNRVEAKTARGVY